jgi:hypothetical protein
MLIRPWLLFSLTSLLLACSSSQNPGDDPDATKTQPDPGASGFQPGLQYEGSIAFESAVVAGSGMTERVEISSPILPSVDIYQYQGSHYPTTDAEQAQVVDEVSLTFSFLLQNCPSKYPGITVRGPNDPPITPAELATNYQLIAKCSYEEYGAKPYWLPQIVDDVDICANELGSEWSLLTESDIASMSNDDFRFIADTLTSSGSGSGTVDGFFGSFYFSLHVYVRDGNGALKRGDLSPGVTTRIGPLPATQDGTTTSHLESDMALRCIRRTSP